MVVKIRLAHGAVSGRIARQQAPFASGLSGLITLLSVSCLLLALWRLTSDLGWTESFVIRDGFLSHWQVWLAFTIAFGALGLRLKRYGQTNVARPFASDADLELVPAAQPEDAVGPRIS